MPLAPFGSLVRLLRDRRGGSQIEYAVLFGLVLVGGTLVFGTVGRQLAGIYEGLVTTLEGGSARSEFGGERQGMAPDIEAAPRPVHHVADQRSAATPARSAIPRPADASPVTGSPPDAGTAPAYSDRAGPVRSAVSAALDYLRDSPHVGWMGVSFGAALLGLAAGLVARRRRRLIASLRRL